jgi:hypothetical protein
MYRPRPVARHLSKLFSGSHVSNLITAVLENFSYQSLQFYVNVTSRYLQTI